MQNKTGNTQFSYDFLGFPERLPERLPKRQKGSRKGIPGKVLRKVLNHRGSINKSIDKQLINNYNNKQLINIPKLQLTHRR